MRMASITSPIFKIAKYLVHRKAAGVIQFLSAAHESAIMGEKEHLKAVSEYQLIRTIAESLTQSG